MSEERISYYDTLVYEDIKHFLNHNVLTELAVELGIKYLAKANLDEIIQERTDRDISGILYGISCKPIINLIIASKEHQVYINVIFLIDLSSPENYLCNKTLNALGFIDKTPETLDFVFRDYVYSAKKSPSNGPLEEINIIGYNFLRHICCKLNLDYKMHEMCIHFSK